MSDRSPVVDYLRLNDNLGDEHHRHLDEYHVDRNVNSATRPAPPTLMMQTEHEVYTDQDFSESTVRITNLPLASSTEGDAVSAAADAALDIHDTRRRRPSTTAALSLDPPSHKRGRVFCLGCCDFRTAVFLIMGLHSLISLLSLCFLAYPPQQLDVVFSILYTRDMGLVDTHTEQDRLCMVDCGILMYDDDMIESVATIAEDAYRVDAMIGAISLVLTAVPLYGAYHYKASLVGFGVILLMATFLARFVLGYTMVEQADQLSSQWHYNQPDAIYVISCLLTTTYVYAYVGLATEIYQGTMSQATWTHERYCSCGWYEGANNGDDAPAPTVATVADDNDTIGTLPPPSHDEEDDDATIVTRQVQHQHPSWEDVMAV